MGSSWRRGKLSEAKSAEAESLKNAMERKVVKFSEDLVNLVLNGEKTSTWRLFDDKDLQVGDILDFVNKQSGKKFAEAVIDKVREKELGNLVNEDYAGHEKFESTEKMYETYRMYYGDKVDSNTLVKIINFHLV